MENLTESRLPEAEALDLKSINEIMCLMQNENLSMLNAVTDALPQTEALIEQCISNRQKGGRIIYIGAGTSGRLAVLDAAECMPTFGVSEDEVMAVIAGGRIALERAIEGAEDDEAAGRNDIEALNLTENDVIIGIAASGRTPYVIGGLKAARAHGSVTGSICCNKDSLISQYADYPIEVASGPEIISGSTRLKAGTAQKLVLNMISTITMIKTGKVYSNYMVDVVPTNEKLKKRAILMLMDILSVDEAYAASLFERSGQHVKTAMVMELKQVDYKSAVQMIEAENGMLRNIL